MKQNAPTAAKRPHVAVLTETTHTAGRNTLRGIGQYIKEHEPWSTYYAPRTLGEKAPSWLKGWKGDGIIARVSSEPVMEELKALGIPFVDMIGGMPTEPGTARVSGSDEGIGRKAADYFMKNGFRNFAFLGMRNEVWSVTRKIAYFNVLHEHGFSVNELLLPSFYDSASGEYRKRSWEKVEEELAVWAATLPAPCAVFCANDDLGRYMIEACRRADIAVPDELALLGVDNDTLFCELYDPPLSSIDANHFGVGYEAASLLDGMMRGEEAPTLPLLVPAGEIIVRTSSDVLAISDPNLASAVHFIRQHACEGISVGDVAAHAFLSRSVLQRRFKAELGQTAHERILQEKLSRARNLLAETSLPLVDIAEKAGFTHQEYMGATFRKHQGTTPAQYRIQSKK
ncbi:MAG: xylose operon transcription regulator XylR [Verrucomicrobia bacterium]|nr:MAG: xylose operon transcription regulator XylR [Verrucomicrobiota bacterium]